MEQEQTLTVTPRSVGIRYGLMLSVLSIAYFVVLNVAGVDISKGFWNWFGWVITIVIVVLAHKYYKDNSDGFMGYGEGVGIGFWTGLISSAIYSVFFYIYIKFVDAGFVEMIRERQIESMEQRGMSDEQIEQAMKYSDMFTSPEMMLIFALIGGIVTALIIALIVSIFTQKKNPEPTF